MSDSVLNPLFAAHERADAEFQAWDRVQIVSTFGQPQAEYSAIHKSCGLIDLPQRAIVEAAGKDRMTFLNNLLTNQLVDKQTKTPVAPGTGVYAFLLNAKNGRIIFDVNVLVLEECVILEIDARFTQSLLDIFDRYKFAEQVKFIPRGGELHEIALHGPGAQQILTDSIAPMPALDAPMNCGADKIIGHDCIVWRDDPCGVPGFHLIVPVAGAQAIWDHLLVRFGGDPVASVTMDDANCHPERTREGSASVDESTRSFGVPQDDKVAAAQREDISGATPGSPRRKRALRPVGWAAFNACRVEAGRPIFGIDFDDSILPAETGQMSRAVSLVKGCYPGQEIVARMHARQQVAKQLVGIRMNDEALPIAGVPIYDGASNSIGAITSSTISPTLSGAAICMGIVKRPHNVLGTKLTIPAEGKMHEGVVVETPFVKLTKEQ